MDTIELIKAKRNSFTVPELRKMLGIKKTDSYWILKHRDIETITINGQIRILQSSFDEWYRNQTKYHIIGGPEPGENLKANSYSPKDIMELLDVSENITYSLISKGCFETFTVDYNIRVTKESFERWYASQTKYRLEEDRLRDKTLIEASYSLPDIIRMLGVHRNIVYHIISCPANQEIFEFVTVAGQTRITIESFNRWYESQNRYTIRKDIETSCEDDKLDKPIEKSDNNDNAPATKIQTVPVTDKEIYRLEEIMALMNIGRKAAYKLIQSGELLAVKAGKSYLIPASEYHRYMERKENNGIDRTEE